MVRCINKTVETMGKGELKEKEGLDCVKVAAWEREQTDILILLLIV